MKKIILYIYFILPVFTFAAGPLTGNYTIDASGSGSTNYTTIASAVSDLYILGISGPVTFDVVGTFNEQIVLSGEITGSSKFNPIIFRNGEITYTATSTTDNFLVKLKSVSFIEFIHIKFTAGGTNYSRIIYSETPSGVITFNGNEFLSNSTTGSSIDKAIVYCVADNTTSFKFTNNTFEGGTYGLFLESHISTKSVGLLVSGNTFSTAFRAIHIDNFDAPKISSNIITNKSIDDYAIYLTDCINDFEIEKNKISTTNDLGSGIKIQNCFIGVFSDRSLIVNNFIQACNKGVSLNNSSDVDLYYNSINVEIASNITNLSSASIYLEPTCSNIILLNNIFANKRDGLCLNAGTSNGGQIILSDHNDFYTTGSNIIRWNSSDYSSLPWLYDSNSFEVDPIYNSIADLHSSSSVLEDKGFPIATITTDIDGEIRNSVTPCIGADEFQLPLAGIYIIGAELGDEYSSITDAVDDVYLKGVAGAVTFKVRAGTYTEQINLDGAIFGSSATNTVTFQSNSGNASDVVVGHNASGAIDNFIVRINVAEHIKFKNLTLTALGDDFAKVVSLENVTGNLEFYGNVMNGYEITSNVSIENQSVVHCNNSGKLDNTTFENNVINDGNYGVFLFLDGGLPKTVNLQIIGNTIVNSRVNNIYIFSADSPKIKSNTCSNQGSASIFLTSCDNNIVIENNKLNVSSGISLIVCNGTASNYGVIKNNFISSSFTGINISGSKYINVYYNTVKNRGSFSTNSAFKVANSGSILTDYIVAKNNIFSAIGGSNAIWWRSGTITECNYNDLYTTGATIVKHGPSGSSIDYVTLADWQVATASYPVPFATDSYSEDVTYVSATDLHIVSTPVPLNGITIPSITTDIDGDTRGTPPFIGADEPTDGIELSLTIMLEGPYNTPEMNASLTLPIASPYNSEAVTSIPNIIGNEVVDWVLVELRDENNSSTVLESQSAFVLKDGSVVDLDGVSPVHFTSPSGNYFVSVKHRNHLAVMSAAAIGL
ncbi:MAG: NosD domain-containing protein [Melioribacteraceae bacterium]